MRTSTECALNFCRLVVIRPISIVSLVILKDNIIAFKLGVICVERGNSSSNLIDWIGMNCSGVLMRVLRSYASCCIGMCCSRCLDIVHLVDPLLLLVSHLRRYRSFMLILCRWSVINCGVGSSIHCR